MSKNKCLTLSILIMLCTLTLLFCSCNKNKNDILDGEPADLGSMSLEELEGFAQVGEYKGLSVTVTDLPKGNAVWDAVRSGTEVREYPEKQVYYYINRIHAEYSYHAEKAGISYNDLLSELSVSEGDILKEAKKLTEDDLIFNIIVKKEGISLSEEEKTEHFDRYVKKYTEEYGYDEEYVRSNMQDIVLQSMLYDKVTEFLILNNSFSAVE